MAGQYENHPPASAGGQERRRRRRRNPVLRVLLAIFKTLGTLLLILLFTGSFLAGFAAVYIQNVILPYTDMDVADYPMNLSSTIYYTDPDSGAVLEYEKLHGDQDRVLVRYDDLPEDLIHATVALEDRRFYTHHGVDWLSTAKGVLTMFTGGNIRGGSSITQQLIKNLTHYDDVTVKRKVLEIFRALEFEKKYDKKQTLEWYLNYVYFGRKCYGVYTASYKYFGKHVSELSLAECASLISITNNPSLYDPYTHPENNHIRRNQALDWMYTEGYISKGERDRAKAEEINFHQAKSDDDGGAVYSWYTEQVITDVVNDLVEQKGYSETVAHDLVYSGGLNIYACVDTKLQAIVDEIYSDVSNLPYTSASGQQLQSAITIVDRNGNIVALSGKLGEKTSEDTRGWNRATRTTRQPGSTIKPLAIYAPALEMGQITPYMVFEDSPAMLLNGKPWPANADNHYRGQMTVDYALANSVNTVAVRVLQMVTPEVGFEYLSQKFGVDSDHLVVNLVVDGEVKTDIAYSPLALGGMTKGLSTLDLAGAYSVFPRDGVYIKPRTYSKVEDSNHKILLQNDSMGQPVLKEKTTYYMNEMLQHVVTEGGGGDAFFSGMTIAGKTGSTDQYNDRWFVGYTPYYTAAVWVGYDISERIKVSSNKINPAAQMWNKVMSRIHEGLPDVGFPSNANLQEVRYCKDSGMLADDLCERDARGSRVEVGHFYPEDVPSESCNVHTTVTVCTADPILNSKGNATGRYRLAGAYCPSVGESEDGLGRRTVAVLDLEREYIGDVRPEDDGYLRSSVSGLGTCTVHRRPAPVETPVPEVPVDPSTGFPYPSTEIPYPPSISAYPPDVTSSSPNDDPHFPIVTPYPTNQPSVYPLPPTETGVQALPPEQSPEAPVVESPAVLMPPEEVTLPEIPSVPSGLLSQSEETPGSLEETADPQANG